MIALHLLLGTFLCIIACCLLQVEGSYRWNRKDAADDETDVNTITKTTSDFDDNYNNYNHVRRNNHNNGRYNNIKRKKSDVQRKSFKRDSNLLNQIRSSKMDFTKISKYNSKRLRYELVLLTSTKKKLERKIKILNRQLQDCQRNELDPVTIGKIHVEKEELRSQLGRALNRLYYLESECGTIKHKLEMDILVLEAQINNLLSNNTALESELEKLKKICVPVDIVPQSQLNVSTDPKEHEAFCNTTCPCKESPYSKNAKMQCFADVEACGLTWDLQNIGGKYFYISKGEKTWHQAREYCRSCNMELAVFDDRNDELDIMDVMFDKLSIDMKSSQFWLGFSDLSVKGIFSNNYRKPDYTNWAPGLPNNDNTEEHCVYIRHVLSVNPLQDDLKWYHDNCNKKKQFICQLSKQCNPYFDELRGNPIRDYSDVIPEFITDEEEKHEPKNELSKNVQEVTTPAEYLEEDPQDTTQEITTVANTLDQETSTLTVEDLTIPQVSPSEATPLTTEDSTIPNAHQTLPDILAETVPSITIPQETTPKTDEFVTLPHVIALPNAPDLAQIEEKTIPSTPLETDTFLNEPLTTLASAVETTPMPEIPPPVPTSIPNDAQDPIPTNPPKTVAPVDIPQETTPISDTVPPAPIAVSFVTNAPTEVNTIPYDESLVRDNISPDDPYYYYYTMTPEEQNTANYEINDHTYPPTYI